MRIAAIRLQPYRLPLVRPWVAAAATLAVRSGMLVCVATADGIVGWGDCAPLPSSGADGHRRAFDELAAFAGSCTDAAMDDVLARLAGAACPEVRWALETALLDARARQQDLPLYRWLGGRETDGVPTNAALGPLDDDCPRRAQLALAQGFALAKIKVGIADADVEAGRLRELVGATGGRLSLRLDANRAWNESIAERFLQSVADLPIDGVEEPLATPTVAQLARLQSALPFAIAVDESLPALGADRLLGAGAVRRLVVKPARLGGLLATLQLAEKARRAGIEVVLTSVVDSAVGVTAAAHLAAALPAGATHGLATLDWLAADVAPRPALVGGRLLFGPGAGLGVVPARESA
ncbi:MAG: o-succinylbenzoate synthase [Rhodocyclaceae bacterium]|nr:o-succinylbenzoate synthase [Rhodocyclaceae bacterium]